MIILSYKNFNNDFHKSISYHYCQIALLLKLVISHFCTICTTEKLLSMQETNKNWEMYIVSIVNAITSGLKNTHISWLLRRQNASELYLQKKATDMGI